MKGKCVDVSVNYSAKDPGVPETWSSTSSLAEGREASGIELSLLG